MATTPFSAFKVDELQMFLKRKVISVSKLKRMDLLRLCDAVVKLNLPDDPDMCSDQPLSVHDILSEFSVEDPADGGCRHIGATLYEIEAFEVNLVTDGGNLWSKRPRQHDCPVPIKQLKIMKARYTGVEYNQSDAHNFDPRSVDQRQNVQKPIENVTGDCDQPCQKCTVFTISNMLKNVKSTAANDPVNLCHLSNDNIAHIESCTAEQSDSKTWHELRKGRLTASNFCKVCKAVDANKCQPSLLKTILGEYGEVTAPSLLWGKKKEVAALQLYMKVCSKSHLHPRLSHKDLRIHPTMDFIGCSIDGLFTCKCHDCTIFEVKCPFSLRDEDPKEVCLRKGCVLNKKVEVIVTENSEYYHQIQGQMGIYGIHQSNLILYTKEKNLCCSG
ncbi:uncharacterized protein LOC134230137 [Saccostrea cucullata]|uniref:uncharacterized protein LOC134230137 n=1 Tax=Saccostrea cuccullata TaxID=36930 RepID=UPI002ED58DC4